MRAVIGVFLRLSLLKMVQSNVSNQVVGGNESTYGTIASTFDLLMGAIESFSWNESESNEAVGAVGSGALPLKNEAGLYLVSGTLTTKPTKTSLPVLLDLFFLYAEPDRISGVLECSVTYASFI